MNEWHHIGFVHPLKVGRQSQTHIKKKKKQRRQREEERKKKKKKNDVNIEEAQKGKKIGEY
jgi:hypothetical protein